MSKHNKLIDQVRHWESVYHQPFEDLLRSLARYGMSKRQAAEVFGLTPNQITHFSRHYACPISWHGQRNPPHRVKAKHKSKLRNN